MLTRLMLKISLFLKPPKKGDVFYGDPVWFVLSRPVEHVLHGLKDKFGNTLYTPIPSDGCFRFVVENTGMPYYILGSEVFCQEKSFNNIGTWMKRTQPRRMGKDMFEEMFLMGLLWRE